MGNLYTTSHKQMLYDISIKWYGNVYPGDVIKYDQERGPPDEVDAGIAVEDMSHELVGFLSGMFCGSQFGGQQLIRKGLQS